MNARRLDLILLSIKYISLSLTKRLYARASGEPSYTLGLKLLTPRRDRLRFVERRLERLLRDLRRERLLDGELSGSELDELESDDEL